MLEWLPALLMPLNDVTTSPDNPPAYVAIAAQPEHKDSDLSYNPEFKVRQKKLYPQLGPLVLRNKKDLVWETLTKLAKEQSHWQIFAEDNQNYRIEAVATTPLMKFKDDVIIELRDIPDGVSVDMRSRSRVGKSDLGANAQRISDFLKSLETELKVD